MLNTLAPKEPRRNGILGKKVEFVTGDTQTKSDAARASAQSMIEKDGADHDQWRFVLGRCRSLCKALCQEAGIIFMAGLTHSNDTTGKDRKANGFRHFFNGYMSGAALGPILEKAAGQRSSRVSPDGGLHLGLDPGRIDRIGSTEAIGWETANKVLTPSALATSRPTSRRFCSPAQTCWSLNHYGGDMVNSLTQAVQFGLRDAQANGKDFQIVVPLYSELMAAGAGANIKGILGSMNWNWQLPDEGYCSLRQILW